MQYKVYLNAQSTICKYIDLPSVKVLEISCDALMFACCSNHFLVYQVSDCEEVNNLYAVVLKFDLDPNYAPIQGNILAFQL